MGQRNGSATSSSPKTHSNSHHPHAESSPSSSSLPPSPVFRLVGYGMAVMFALCSLHVSRQMLVVNDTNGSSSILRDATTSVLEYGLLRRTSTAGESFRTKAKTTTQTNNFQPAYVTWLMSFPNSGTTFTWKNMQHLTQQATATIYETEFDDDDDDSRRLVEAPHLLSSDSTSSYASLLQQQQLFSQEHIPQFFLYNASLPVPSNLLVKTHCANYCDACPFVPTVELEYDLFEQGCRTGTQRRRRNDDEADATTTAVASPYRPHRLLHLLRHPLDNIVARMHRGIYKRRKYLQWNDAQLSRFNDSRSGLQAWCDYTSGRAVGAGARSSVGSNDTKVSSSTATAAAAIQQALEWLDDNDSDTSSSFAPYSSWSELSASVPCVFDLVRYTMWHNHALRLAAHYQIPVLHVYYEDYASLLPETSLDILEFLRSADERTRDVVVSMPREPLAFDAADKTYSHLFTAKERMAAARLVKRLSSKDLWPLVRHYVHEWFQQTNAADSGGTGDKREASQSASSMQQQLPSTTLHHGFTSDIVWLMSFPNSGTSYTMNNVRRTSNKTTATNYAAEAIQTAGTLVPVKPSLPDGPFLLLPNMQVPKYSLTKTHCTAYCDACQTMDTVRALDQFEEGCRMATKGVWPNLTKIAQRYVPAKSVHIFRSPFDNLVARKHLGSKRRLSLGIFKPEDRAFQDSREGMVAWCDFIDKGFITSAHNKGIKPFTSELEALFRKVPCYSDWFRYIQWHDLALAAVERMEIPIHYIYYESYTDEYDETVRELNQFLELETVVEPEPFITGKVYRHFFSKDDVRHARDLVKYLSTMNLWKKLRHYFDDDQFNFNDEIHAVEADGSDVDSSNDDFADEEDNGAVGALGDEHDEATDDGVSSDETDDDAEGDDDGKDSNENVKEANTPSDLVTPRLARPEVVWLMSFPNSGTSYTITNIQHMSNKTQATNHGMEANESFPLLPELPHGPFILDRQKEIGRYTLVKTHCTGYCDVCNQTQSKKKLRAFQMGCVSTKRNEDGVFVVHKYNESLPKKAIHVFRNPFDNMVARMHLGVKDRRMAGFPSSLLDTFNDTQAGILSWCRYMDAEFAKASNTSYFSEETNQLMTKVPCHSDLFRYIQWHNLAIHLTEKLKLPNLMIHYEDYATKYNKTMDGLLNFLDITPVQEPLDFVLGKTYQHLYGKEHARSMAILARSMATPACWDEVRRYFEEYFAVEDKNLLASKAATTR